MNEFFNFVIRFIRSFQLFVVVMPWESALRVWMGKERKVLSQGIHWKLPFVHNFYIQSIRLRVMTLAKQTMTTRDGKTITLQFSLGYCIEDIDKLYQNLHHAEDSVKNIAQGVIADHITTHNMEDCLPTSLEPLSRRCDLSRYGLGSECFYPNDWAVVRTYRIVGDYQPYQVGSALATDQALGKIA